MKPPSQHVCISVTADDSSGKSISWSDGLGPRKRASAAGRLLTPPGSTVFTIILRISVSLLYRMSTHIESKTVSVPGKTALLGSFDLAETKTMTVLEEKVPTWLVWHLNRPNEKCFSTHRNVLWLFAEGFPPSNVTSNGLFENVMIV